MICLKIELNAYYANALILNYYKRGSKYNEMN